MYLPLFQSINQSLSNAMQAYLSPRQSQPKHHFTLGNVYAVLGDYNKSSICYENALTLLPTYEAAVDRWHAVLCHRKLEKALENQHKSLQRTLEDLKEYQKRHEEWQQQNDKLISEQVERVGEKRFRMEAVELSSIRDEGDEGDDGLFYCIEKLMSGEEM